MSKLAVIGENEKAGCISVESSYGKDPLFNILEKIEYGSASARVSSCYNVSDGLVEENIGEAAGKLGRSSVNTNFIQIGIDKLGQRIERLAVYFYPARKYQLFSSSSRAETTEG